MIAAPGLYVSGSGIAVISAYHRLCLGYAGVLKTEAEIMTLLQEAYTLMQGQSEKNIRLIVDLLQTMSPKENVPVKKSTGIFRRTGLTKAAVNLPEDFDETFDALDRDIEELFYGDIL